MRRMLNVSIFKRFRQVGELDSNRAEIGFLLKVIYPLQ
jgi:hypothetical protein